MSDHTTTTQALAERDKTTSVIEQYRPDFEMMLPSHIKADQWMRLTQGVFRRNKDLQRILVSNPGSVLAALLDAARLGLEVGDTYHLVPFKNEIVGVTDYTGLIELIYRAGAVASVKVELVYSGDIFTWIPGEMDRPDHRPDWFSNRGDMIGAYSYAVMKDGSTSQVVLMNRAEIEKVRAVSPAAKSASSPWNTWPDRMWKKTVIRQLAKYVPTSTEYVREQLRAVADAHTQPPAPTPTFTRVHIPEPLTDDAPVDGVLVDEDTGEVIPE